MGASAVMFTEKGMVYRRDAIVGLMRDMHKKDHTATLQIIGDRSMSWHTRLEAVFILQPKEEKDRELLLDIIQGPQHSDFIRAAAKLRLTGMDYNQLSESHFARFQLRILREAAGGEEKFENIARAIAADKVNQDKETRMAAVLMMKNGANLSEIERDAGEDPEVRGFAKKCSEWLEREPHTDPIGRFSVAPPPSVWARLFQHARQHPLLYTEMGIAISEAAYHLLLRKN